MQMARGGWPHKLLELQYIGITIRAAFDFLSIFLDGSGCSPSLLSIVPGYRGRLMRASYPCPYLPTILYYFPVDTVLTVDNAGYSLLIQ
jgi:hypothetical protein